MAKNQKTAKPVINVMAELYSYKSVFTVEQKITDAKAEKVKEAIKTVLGETEVETTD